MFAKTPTKVYHSGIEKLSRAEAAYRHALEALQTALDQRRANDVPGLRKKAATAELELRAALTAASIAWGDYWRQRRAEIEPSLHEAARHIRQYNALCRVTRDGGTTPGQTFIQNLLIESVPVDLLDDSGVPAESPDSAVLEDYKGDWR